MIERSDHVKVTSGKETIVGRWNGEDYEFRPGQPEVIHKIVAAHIFGFGLEDKAPALARLGWAQSSDQLKAAMQRLQAVHFGPAPALVDAPEPELVGAAAGERMPNRTPSGAPIAGGGEAGAAPSTAPAEPRPAGKPQHR